MAFQYNRAFIPFLVLLSGPLAHAECPILNEVLEERTDDLMAFSTRNSTMMASVLKMERDCHEQGAKVSAKIAIAAESLTCQAQADAAEINREMESIGRTCTTAFQKRHELQTLLHTDFNTLLRDVSDGVGYIVKSQILNEECADEVLTARKLYKATHVTEGNIVATELRALSAMNSYEKFRETSEQLKKQTLARNVACGQQPDNSILPPLPKGAPGQGAPAVFVAGKSPRESSEITGKIEDTDLASLEAQKVDRVKFPGEKYTKKESRITASAKPVVPPTKDSVAAQRNQGSATGAALEVFTKKALLPQKTALMNPEPSSALQSVLLSTWQASAQNGEGAPPADSAPTSTPEAKPPVPSSEEPHESDGEVKEVLVASQNREPASEKIQFLGEIRADGTVGSAPDPRDAETLFTRVRRVYQKQQAQLQDPSAEPVVAFRK